MTDAAEEAGVALNFDTGYEAVSYPDGKLTKRFDVIKPVLNADGVINLCKLKTHTYMGMTGAVKNSFGVIPGLSKPGFHAKLSDPNHFANMLLDLSTLVSPRLSITDAVVGMEGDGPGNGSPRRIGLLLASTNPLALDVVGSAIMSLPRQHNPVLLAAEERGLAPNRIDDVELVDADGGCVSIDDLRVEDFDLPANAGGVGLESANWWQRSLMPLFKQALTVRPEVVEERCIACGVCRKACPVHAISIGANGRDAARIDDGTCIRCYCCHEMCPQDAITLHKSLLYRLAERF
jgi:ferredoxin